MVNCEQAGGVKSLGDEDVRNRTDSHAQIISTVRRNSNWQAGGKSLALAVAVPIIATCQHSFPENDSGARGNGSFLGFSCTGTQKLGDPQFLASYGLLFRTPVTLDASQD